MTPRKQKNYIAMEDEFQNTQVAKPLLALTATLALFYFVIIVFWFPRGNAWLFWLLIAGEIFHIWQLLTFIHTIWDTEYQAKGDYRFAEPVDVFITVAGEPVDIVETTARAALSMDYPNFRVYILNDGYVAKKDNWQEIEKMAGAIGAYCITRKEPGGAKAGNINNALRASSNPFVAIFDADHIPHRNFLRKTMLYFVDGRVGFVQTPQYYKNHGLNQVTTGSWEQQELWFGPLCKGKNRLNSASMCGTNMVIRRSGLVEVGGMCTESIAEDFITGMFMHSRGWKSIYIPEVLAEGLAPEDFLSYYKQQFRWARGALDAIFRFNIFFRPGLTFVQRIQYLSSASYFVSGIVVLMNALLPVIFLFTGLMPFEITTMMLAAIFLPYIFITLYVLRLSSNYTFTFKSVAFSMAGFPLHFKALLAALFRTKSTFAVTSKTAVQGNFIRLVMPQIAYVALALGAFPFALLREGATPAVITNFAWAMLNVGIFSEFIRAALPHKNEVIARASIPTPFRDMVKVPRNLNNNG